MAGWGWVGGWGAGAAGLNNGAAGRAVPPAVLPAESRESVRLGGLWGRTACLAPSLVALAQPLYDDRLRACPPRRPAPDAPCSCSRDAARPAVLCA